MKTQQTQLEAIGAPADEYLSPDQERNNQPKSESHLLPLLRSAEGATIPEFSRLVVLVPDRDVDEIAFARKVWAILRRRRSSVLFVTLVTDSNYGPGAQRRLVTLGAITQDVFYRIETRVLFGSSWAKGLEEIVQPGDLIVCHATQRSRPFLHAEVALSDSLRERVKAPVMVLSGLYQEVITQRPSRWLRQFVIWGILVGILTGFFIFEADIDRLTSGWLSSVLFILVFAVELLLIWMWNFLRT